MKLALLLDSARSFGGQPLASSRLLTLMTGLVDLTPIWLEQPVERPRRQEHGAGFRLFPPSPNGFPWLLRHLQQFQGFHLHGVFGWARYASALPGPFIASFRGSDLNLGVYRQPEILNAVSRSARVCTFMNPHQQMLANRLLERTETQNQFIVPNHRLIEEVEPATLDLPRPIVCCVNEFRRLTGLDFLLRAFQQLGRGTLLLVGPLHPAEAPYYSQILDKQRNVHRTGAVSPRRVLQLLKASDLAVFPSVCEGMPNKVLEAMSVGVPIVASDVAGIRYLLSDRLHGRLFSSRDADHLRQVMGEALDAPPQERLRWTEAARKKLLSEHAPEREREAWRVCYRLLDESPS